MTVLSRTLSLSQQTLLASLVDLDCVQYLSSEGLELHDVSASALLNEIASVIYPFEEVDDLVSAGLIRLVTPDEYPFSDRPYYELTDRSA